MVEFSSLHIGQIVYVIDNDTISVMELQILDMRFNDDHIQRIKVSSIDMMFEVDYKYIKDDLFIDKDLAHSMATKYIFDETNKYIREITDDHFQDYFDLDKALEKYKKIHPEIFI